uniref:HDC02647 n=1 Tax=Drosophila melanogaster TaxID=7227 RepID=Q6IHF8_DROME|nr:TPA_inf: HDC02647 [Drosophila melanogaster]
MAKNKSIFVFENMIELGHVMQSVACWAGTWYDKWFSPSSGVDIVVPVVVILTFLDFRGSLRRRSRVSNYPTGSASAPVAAAAPNRYRWTCD